MKFLLTAAALLFTAMPYAQADTYIYAQVRHAGDRRLTEAERGAAVAMYTKVCDPADERDYASRQFNRCMLSHGLRLSRVERQAADPGRCSAKVLDIGDTGVTENDNPVARLTLRVTSPGRGGGFVTTIEATVSRLKIPRVGDTLAATCDPANPTSVTLD